MRRRERPHQRARKQLPDTNPVLQLEVLRFSPDVKQHILAHHVAVRGHVLRRGPVLPLLPEVTSLPVSVLCSQPFHTTELWQSPEGSAWNRNTASTLRSPHPSLREVPRSPGTQSSPLTSGSPQSPTPLSVLSPQGGFAKRVKAPTGKGCERKAQGEAVVRTGSWAPAPKLPALTTVSVHPTKNTHFLCFHCFFPLGHSFPVIKILYQKMNIEETVSHRARCWGRKSLSGILARSQFRNEHFCLHGAKHHPWAMILLLSNYFLLTQMKTDHRESSWTLNLGGF